MKRLLCCLLGHKWPLLHVDFDTRTGDLIVEGIGHCVRRGKKGGDV